MRIGVWMFALVAVAGTLALPATAHESRPAYLEITQTGPETCAVVLKVPARGEQRLGLHPVLPPMFEALAPPTAHIANGAYIERSSYRCPNGLTGQPIRMDGLTGTLTDVLVRVTQLDGTTQTVRLTPADPSFFIASSPGRGEVVRTYFALGVEHILSGIDHLLFVLGLLLIVRGWRKLIGTITAFTVAHSVTLAAAALGLVTVPGAPVEAVIALSIVFLAVEIIHGQRGRQGLTHRAPWIVAFGFGLLHGFGFAGALSEIGLPQNAIPLALLFFNVGVEAGQLLFVGGLVATAAIMMRLGRVVKVPQARAEFILCRCAAYAIGSVAFYWVVERTKSF